MKGMGSHEFLLVGIHQTYQKNPHHMVKLPRGGGELVFFLVYVIYILFVNSLFYHSISHIAHTPDFF